MEAEFVYDKNTFRVTCLCPKCYKVSTVVESYLFTAKGALCSCGYDLGKSYSNLTHTSTLDTLCSQGQVSDFQLYNVYTGVSTSTPFVSQQCPQCFAINLATEKELTTTRCKCKCGWDFSLAYAVNQSKKCAEEKEKCKMLYNLTIKTSGYSSGNMFRGTALTYEQCSAQISRCENLAKAKNETITVEMTPTVVQGE